MTMYGGNHVLRKYVNAIYDCCNALGTKSTTGKKGPTKKPMQELSHDGAQPYLLTSLVFLSSIPSLAPLYLSVKLSQSN